MHVASSWPLISSARYSGVGEAVSDIVSRCLTNVVASDEHLFSPSQYRYTCKAPAHAFIQNHRVGYVTVCAVD